MGHPHKENKCERGKEKRSTTKHTRDSQNRHVNQRLPIRAGHSRRYRRTFIIERLILGGG
jgi:hypothetical protein